MKVQNADRLNLELSIVFLDSAPAKKMNFQYRQKNYATDVLSFDGDFIEGMGELILCPEVLKKQKFAAWFVFSARADVHVDPWCFAFVRIWSRNFEKRRNACFIFKILVFDKIVNL